MSYEILAQMPPLQGQTYWLAEPQNGLLEKLYELETDPDPVQLFADTAFSAQASQSPLVFTLSASGGLVTQLADQPDVLSGLLISTGEPRTLLLQHLRGLLEARFLQGRKALLRFYDPRVASYLLPTCCGSLQERWLGPIDEIAWYGATWLDEASAGKRWHLLQHVEHPSSETPAVPLTIDDAQLQRLVDQGYERFAWQWIADKPGYGLEQVLDWIRTGIAAGHTKQDSLTAWLNSQAMLQGARHG